MVLSVEVFGVTFSELQLALTIGSPFLGFLIFYFYWDQDKKTENYDERCQNTISEHDAFRGIRSEIPTNLIATSNTRTSDLRAMILKNALGKISDRPQKIVVMDSPTMEERKKTVIFENAKEISGKSIIQRELAACLRNYFAFKLAVEEEGAGSDIAFHFKDKYRKYDHANRVQELDKTTSYEGISLKASEKGEKNALKDVFLPLLKGTEKHCVQPISDHADKLEKMDECQQLMMATFFDFFSKNSKGMILNQSLLDSECIDAYRSDIKDEDNIGYWLLLEPNNDNEDFDRFRSIAWRIREDVLDEYWSEENLSELYPTADSLPAMEKVDYPFILYRKDLEAFKYASTADRIQGEEKFRRKQ